MNTFSRTFPSNFQNFYLVNISTHTVYYIVHNNLHIITVVMAYICMAYLYCRRYQYMAYRQLVRRYWGTLGRRIRVVLPSCCVVAIRDKFPSQEYFQRLTGKDWDQTTYRPGPNLSTDRCRLNIHTAKQRTVLYMALITSTAPFDSFGIPLMSSRSVSTVPKAPIIIRTTLIRSP